MNKIFTLLIIFTLSFFPSKAFTGCYVPDGSVFRIFPAVPVPGFSNFIVLNTSDCAQSAYRTSTYVRRSEIVFIGAVGSCMAISTQGQTVSYPATYVCPLDAEVWLLIFISGCIGFFVCRQNYPFYSNL
jgi:hypothetical protein